MKMKIEVNSDWVDQLVILSIEDSIKNLKREIQRMKKGFSGKRSIKDYEKADLANCILQLEHLKHTHEYYGGNLRRA